MAHAVNITPQAIAEINQIANWYNEQQAGIGEEWLRRIEGAISSLEENPEKCGLAHESEALNFELRELLYGSGRTKTHRILFRVTDEKVIVLGIRHVAQQDVSPDDFSIN